MTLKEYLASEDVTQMAFARRLTRRAKVVVQQSSVSRWCRGAVPYRLMQAAIERETGGAVPMSSWPARSMHMMPQHIEQSDAEQS